MVRLAGCRQDMQDAHGLEKVTTNPAIQKHEAAIRDGRLKRQQGVISAAMRRPLEVGSPAEMPWLGTW